MRSRSFTVIKSRPRLVIALLLVLLPVLAFYSLVFRTVTSLPSLDDYDTVLRFVNRIAQEPNLGSRLLEVIAWQHMQYKLIFEHAIFFAQYGLTHHLDFIALNVLGDLFVLLIGAELWLFFRPAVASFEDKLLLFAPAVLLFFQLQYWETLNWAMASLQNLPVLAFALLAVYLLTRQGAASLWFACLSLCLAIASSGNGFFLALTGTLLLLQQRRRKHLVFWLAATALMLPVYLFRYQFLIIRAPGSYIPAWVPTLYPFSFLGGVGEIVRVSVVVGIALSTLFAKAAISDYRKTNPAAFYVLVFLVITALGVTVTRFSFGLAGSISSRYAMYPALMVIFCYFFVVEECCARPQGAQWQWLSKRPQVAIAIAILLAAAFSVREDVRGFSFLQTRQRETLQQMALWEQTNGRHSPIPGSDRPDPLDPGRGAFYIRANQTLQNSVRLHVYAPAPLP